MVFDIYLIRSIMANYRQTCKWSGYSIAMTVLVIGIVGLLGCFNSPRECDTWLHFLVRILLPILVICGVYYSPMFIEVNHTHLYITRLLRKKAIALSDIESVSRYERTMNFARFCGGGGFFGFWGWYRNQELGKFFVYATRLDQLVLVKLKSGRKYVLSCENADKMADAVNHYLKQL